MKRCPKCGETKDRSLFHRDSTKHDGRTAHCKQCRRETQKEYHTRPEVREHRRQLYTEYMRPPVNKERKRQYMKEYKQRPEVMERKRERDGARKYCYALRVRHREQLVRRRKIAQQALWELVGIFVNTHLAPKVLRSILNPPKEATNA